MKKLAMACIILALSSVPLYSQAEKKEERKKAGPDGYASLRWGTGFTEAKENVRGQITFYDDKRIIISKDADIEYRYGFFFQEGENGKKVTPEEKKGQEEQAAAEAKLYYVLIRFPYLHMEDVKKRIEEQYGPPTGENMKNNQGAVIWDFENTSIVMWIDNYEKDPFCRKITYVGKELAKSVNNYQRRVFTAREREILGRLQP